MSSDILAGSALRTGHHVQHALGVLFERKLRPLIGQRAPLKIAQRLPLATRLDDHRAVEPTLFTHKKALNAGRHRGRLNTYVDHQRFLLQSLMSLNAARRRLRRRARLRPWTPRAA